MPGHFTWSKWLYRIYWKEKLTMNHTPFLLNSHFLQSWYRRPSIRWSCKCGSLGRTGGKLAICFMWSFNSFQLQKNDHWSMVETSIFWTNRFQSDFSSWNGMWMTPLRCLNELDETWRLADDAGHIHGHEWRLQCQMVTCVHGGMD